MNHSLRKANIVDFDILFQINKLAYKPYVEQIWGWDEDWQYNFFKEKLEIEEIDMIMVNDKPVGFISMDYREDLIFGESIALLPDFQSKGIGSQVIEGLMVESEKLALPLCIQVFKVNTRARKLYERLGFNLYGESETHFKFKMEPTPPN